VLLDRLARILPAQALLVGDAMDACQTGEAVGAHRPRFVLRPGSTEEVAACLAACDAARQPLVVHGGRTGLSGAHRVLEGEGVLSLERMVGLGPVDPGTATVPASAGTTLQAVQEAADAAGFVFGVDIGARGTATIGGNVATNAGGIRVLRHGMFRAQVAGLEAVLADGSVLDGLRGLVKDNSGYDLNQLFIGSEGTLGVVTRVLLRLHPKPVAEANALVAVPSFRSAIDLMARLRAAVGEALSAIELLTPEVFDGAIDLLGQPRPVAARALFYVLAEVQAMRADDTSARFEACLMAALEDGEALDAALSQSPREFHALWALRHACGDVVRARGTAAVGGDLSLPIGRMEDFLRAARRSLFALDPATEFLVFGHLGDGNLHYVVATAEGPAAMERIHHLAALHGGSVSAEHGIGLDKKPWLHLTRSDAEIATMRRLKAALDPNAILNRGRIFDPIPVPAT
jgi:FAD/FMN-containing dehydrogenase